MLNLSSFKFADGHIESVHINESSVDVVYCKWNNEKAILRFSNYLSLRDNNSVNQDVNNVLVTTNSLLIDEVRKSMVSEGESSDETEDIKQYDFVSAWDGKNILLSIVADGLTIETVPE